jgi:hypothetical protein
MDRSNAFRKAAAECLKLARATSDPSTRTSLLTMAQRWSELASSPCFHKTFDALVQDFNDRQMSRP